MEESNSIRGAIQSRLPYFLLAPASFAALYGLQKAASSVEGVSSQHNVGLFFFPGVVVSDCSDVILRKSYFLLHLTMSYFIGVICRANRRRFVYARRIFFFSWAYLAVGIAAPLQFLFTGDDGIFNEWSALDEAHQVKGHSTVVDDADYDTFCVLFINIGWFLLSHFPNSTCEEMYEKQQPVNTVFDYGTIIWAGTAMIPLVLYKWRCYLPSIWGRFGYRRPGSGYVPLALLNAFFVAAFFAREFFVIEPRDDAAFFGKLSGDQRTMYEWHHFAAVVDYIAMALTMCCLAYRSSRRPNIFICALVLLLPPVGFPLFLSSRLGGGSKHK